MKQIIEVTANYGHKCAVCKMLRAKVNLLIA